MLWEIFVSPTGLPQSSVLESIRYHWVPKKPLLNKPSKILAKKLVPFKTTHISRCSVVLCSFPVRLVFHATDKLTSELKWRKLCSKFPSPDILLNVEKVWFIHSRSLKAEEDSLKVRKNIYAQKIKESYPNWKSSNTCFLEKKSQPNCCDKVGCPEKNVLNV